ncbi:hypothetical protein LB506_007196 [Fusarium annulatum]|nr:hypothetical protein LB506_007196 [Fusarium annulatum]
MNTRSEPLCSLEGRSDVYGVGIRAAFYAQWLGSLLMENLSEENLTDLRFISLFSSAAASISLVIGVAYNSLEPLDIYFLLLLAMGFHIFQMPLYIWRILTRCQAHLDPFQLSKESHGHFYHLMSLTVLSANVSIGTWCFTTFLPQLDRDCRDLVFLFGKQKVIKPRFSGHREFISHVVAPKMSSKEASKSKDKDKSKVHKLSLKGSARLVAEFFQYSIHSILFQRGVYPAEDFTVVKKYGLNMLVSADDQVKAYIKKIMSQLDKWMVGGKISKLVIVITDKDTGEHVERWQFDVQIFQPVKKSKSSKSSSKDQENAAPAGSAPTAPEKTETEIQAEIAAIFRQITASVTFLPQLSGDCTFNVLVYADADSEVPVEWGDSDAKEIENGEKVQLRGFSTANHRVDTLVSYRFTD